MGDATTTGVLRPGSVFGPYRIERLLADGDSGSLYLATLVSLARPVSLTLIRADVADVPGYRERFLRSWRIAGSLDHPSVIPIHDAGERDGQLFLASRYVDGIDLETLVRRDGILEEPRAARVIAKVASALDAAHSRGLVHAGLTAGDIILTRSGDDEHVYVTGFHAERHEGDGRPDLRALARVMEAAIAPSREPLQSADRGNHQGAAALRAVLARAQSAQTEEAYPTGRALAAAATTAAPPAPLADHETRPGADRRPTRRLRIAIAALAGLAIAGVTTVLLGGTSPPPTTPLAGRVIGPPIRTGDGPYGVTVGAGYLWVTNTLDDTVVRIDPATHRRVGRPIPVGNGPHAIAFGEDGVWVANNDADTVVRLDPRTGRVVGRPIPVGEEPEAIAIGAGSVWTLNLEGTVTRIDPRTMRAATPPIVVGPHTIGGGLAFAGGRLWVTEATEDTVSAIDPASNRVVGRPLRVGDEPWGVAGDGNAIWVANYADGTVVAVDARTARIRGEPVAVGGSPLVVAADAGEVWVAGDDNRLTRIDGRAARIAGRPVPVGENTNSIAIGAGGVWLPHYDDRSVTHVLPFKEDGA